MKSLPFLFPAFLLFAPLIVKAQTPVQGKVTHIIDGDTVEISLRLRLRDIDAPEIMGKCRIERQKAVEAADLLKRALPIGYPVFLRELGSDRYGRLLAKLERPDGSSPGKVLIAKDLAVPFGSGKPDWCQGKIP